MCSGLLWASAGEWVSWSGDGSGPTAGRCISGKPGTGHRKGQGRSGWVSEATGCHPQACSPGRSRGHENWHSPSLLPCQGTHHCQHTHSGPQCLGPASLCPSLQKSLTSELQPDLSLPTHTTPPSRCRPTTASSVCCPRPLEGDGRDCTPAPRSSPALGD